MAGALPHEVSSQALSLRLVLLNCLRLCAACVAVSLSQTAVGAPRQVCRLLASTAAFEILHDADAQQLRSAAALLAVRLVQMRNAYSSVFP